MSSRKEQEMKNVSSLKFNGRQASRPIKSTFCLIAFCTTKAGLTPTKERSNFSHNFAPKNRSREMLRAGGRLRWLFQETWDKARNS